MRAWFRLFLGRQGVVLFGRHWAQGGSLDAIGRKVVLWTPLDAGWLFGRHWTQGGYLDARWLFGRHWTQGGSLDAIGRERQ